MPCGKSIKKALLTMWQHDQKTEPGKRPCTTASSPLGIVFQVDDDDGRLAKVHYL